MRCMCEVTTKRKTKKLTWALWKFPASPQGSPSVVDIPLPWNFLCLPQAENHFISSQQGPCDHSASPHLQWLQARQSCGFILATEEAKYGLKIKIPHAQNLLKNSRTAAGLATPAVKVSFVTCLFIQALIWTICSKRGPLCSSGLWRCGENEKTLSCFYLSPSLGFCSLCRCCTVLTTSLLVSGEERVSVDSSLTAPRAWNHLWRPTPFFFSVFDGLVRNLSAVPKPAAVALGSLILSPPSPPTSEHHICFSVPLLTDQGNSDCGEDLSVGPISVAVLLRARGWPRHPSHSLTRFPAPSSDLLAE